jgi:transglutaminase-like putative cysteine protease
VYGENYVSLEESDSWIVHLWRRYRPTTGWGIFLLALSAVVLLPAALMDGELIPGLAPAVSLSIVGFIFTWWLAQRKISGPLAALVILLAGIVADLLWGVFALRPAALAPQLAEWWTWTLGDRSYPEPGVTYFREQGAELTRYFERVAAWVRGLIVGPGAPDNLAVIGVVVLLAWLLAAWAAWWVVRRREPFIALVPTGIFLAQQAYWTPDTISYVLVFLAVTVFLLVLARLVFQTREWDAAGVDYAEDIRVDVIFAGLALTMLVTFASPALPFVASPEFSQKFWTLFEAPWRRVESQVSASFQVERPVRSLVPPTGAQPGGLPRAHLLGGRPELGKEVALRVRVRGDPSNVELYWRGQTYAEYTGYGWESGADGAQIQALPAGQPWGAELPSTEGRRPILAAVQVVEGSRSVIYAPGEPVSVDRPYRSIVRGPDDLVALTASGGNDEYTALSYVPEQDAGRLRAAGTEYPAAITARHLQLPDNLDPRLAELARSWTAGTSTPYDAAVAIERELRKIPYSLDVPTPPEGRELVSWFLFDLKKGYCDYYASAMVALARLSGIPARLAIGYATGDFDEKTGQYVVTELAAHSWPELYFPGAGWVPFEPTASRPAPPRPESATASMPPPGIPRGPEDLPAGLAEIRASAQQNAAAERREATTRWTWALVLGLALAWAAWLTWVNTRPIPSESGAAVRSFARLARWGGRLGRPLRSGETAREYAFGLAAAAEQVSARAPQAAGVVRAESAALAQDVERSLYGPDAADQAGMRERPALWAALRRVWLASRLGVRLGGGQKKTSRGRSGQEV